MKICLTVNSSPWSRFKGGGQIAVHHLATALSNHGQEVHVVYSRSPGDPKPPPTNYIIHWVRHFDLATFNCNIFSFAWRMLLLAKKEQFDVIHSNAEEGFFLSYLAWIHGAGYFFTSHAPFIPPTGFIQGLRNPIFFLKRLNSYLLRSTAKSAKHITTFSQFSRKSVIEGLWPDASPQVEIISPGVDPAWFEGEPDPADSKDIIFWGRLEDEKGLPELLQAMPSVKAFHPDVMLHIIGEGNRRNDYRKMVADLKLEGNCIFHGWMKLESIRNLAQKCRLSVFPSRIESFGLSIIEAMAAGVPVVTTAAGALSEIVENGVTGTLVSGDPLERLAPVIVRAINQDGPIRNMAKCARQIVRNRFSWNCTAEKMVDFYRKNQNNE